MHSKYKYMYKFYSSRQTLVESNIFDRLLESVLYIENKAQNNCSILVCGDSIKTLNGWD